MTDDELYIQLINDIIDGEIDSIEEISEDEVEDPVVKAIL